MMNLLIPVFSPATGTWGALTRVIAIAEAAQQAGHQVAFCASGDLLSTLQQRGFTVYSSPPTTLLVLPAPLSRTLAKRSQRVTMPVRPGRDFGNIWLVLLLSGMARTGYLLRLVEAGIALPGTLRPTFYLRILTRAPSFSQESPVNRAAAAYQTPMA